MFEDTPEKKSIEIIKFVVCCVFWQLAVCIYLPDFWDLNASCLVFDPRDFFSVHASSLSWNEKGYSRFIVLDLNSSAFFFT